MSGADFVALVESAEDCPNLRIKMPTYKLDYTITLNDTLKELGVNRIFNGKDAELRGLGSSGGNLYVDTVLQKTHIDVNTEGTRAAAVTGIFVLTMAFPPPQYRDVILDRPFVYAIIDNATATPLFLGTVENPLA
jgi:serpin B